MISKNALLEGVISRCTTSLTGLFVTNKAHVGDSPGGVQTCSQEYLDLLSAANIAIDILEIDVDRSIETRLIRHVRTSAYTGSVSSPDLRRIETAAESVDIVFLNQVNLASALGRLQNPAAVRRKVVLLSHGAEVTDLLNLIRARKHLPLSGRLRPTPEYALRNVLTDEIAARIGIQAAVCLSPFDADFERWLGVPEVTWIPRTVTPRPLEWKPVTNRFGFLGTLDHAPNLEGLVHVLEAIKRSRLQHLEIRVVGGPPRLGQWLAQRYEYVRYLGVLDNARLEPEAATWSAFLNPIFCQARGCSTKLATSLAWQIPIITTPVGCRGYAFSDGDIPVAESVEEFVSDMNSMADPSKRERIRDAVRRAACSAPTIFENALQLKAFLGRMAQSHT